jgi:hypothetical protein
VNQPLADLRPIAIGGVDEIHAKFGQTAQHPQSFGAIFRLAPDSTAGDTHGAEAETIDGQVSANGELAGRGGVILTHA